MWASSTRMPSLGGGALPGDRCPTVAIAPALSSTVRKGAVIASARNENALIRLLLPEPLRPTRIVGLSKVMQADGMLRK